jgi:N-acetylneuraminic acid mutarotase
VKGIVYYSFLIIITGCIGSISCKKDSYVPPVIMLPPIQNDQPLISLGTLSISREYVCAAKAGSKILFAGGARQLEPSIIACSRVDIYDTITQTWSTAELSMPRVGLMATSLGNKIYFVDGYINNSSRVDIYDASTNLWSTDELSAGRSLLAAGAAANKIVFAGGIEPFGDKINIFDTSTNTWSTSTLNEPRINISATSLANKIYFSGGSRYSGEISNKVDVYDALSNTWSSITMTEPRTLHTSITAHNKIFWAGGSSSYDSNGEYISNNSVEIRDLNNGSRIFHQLSHTLFYNTVINNKVIFFTAFDPLSYSVDIYNLQTQTWSVRDISLSAPAAIGWPASIVGSGNKLFLAEGLIGSNPSRVWKLEF